MLIATGNLILEILAQPNLPPTSIQKTKSNKNLAWSTKIFKPKQKYRYPVHPNSPIKNKKLTG